MAPTDLLLVEGADDVYVFVEILRHHNIPLNEPKIEEPGKISLEGRGGIERLLENLPLRLNIIETRRIGIVVDADEVPAERWTSLVQILRDKGYSDLPVIPDSSGTIVTHPTRPKVGIWLMPNNQLPGTIENFAQSLIAPSDELWRHAEASVDAIPQSLRRWRPSYEMKAKIHTWLAWQEEPGAPMGLALKRRNLDTDSPQFTPLIAWLRRTFEV